ncbi:hypothetical protein KC19_VG333700 [Ceratodon purpureus]|uniref:Uncharacterized protein n=1 Tax=Ceratodon purpureus TaxID=3225 RepID=A0A8T0HWP8_CERPU|nr:hypothetical protein KC19_VG333700 [Ceratodon purpureus]
MPTTQVDTVGLEEIQHRPGHDKGRRVPRLRKEEKGKSKAKPKKPKTWLPPTNIRPTAAVGVTTRARRTLEFEEQEKEDADAAIWNVL